MAINTTSQSIESCENSSFQTYQDMTFVFGPPLGERYEMLATIARRSGESFSKTYALFIEHAFSGLEMQSMFDRAFSLASGVNLATNEYFLTEQCLFDRQEKLKKFYLTDHDESVEVPAVMVFPPKFTHASGESLTIDVEMHHAHFVSVFIGRTFELDWIDINAVVSGAQIYSD